MSAAMPPSTNEAGRAAATSAPLQVHAWSGEYLLLKAIALSLRSIITTLTFIGEWLYYSIPKEVEATRTTIPSREKGRRIRAILYTPKDAPPDRKLPLHLNFHGSGFVLPSLGSDIEFCGLMAKQLGCVVIDCDYRKAPEYPSPAQVQDVEDCILWALSQDATYDTSRISIGGFSAGGNLALCASSLYGDRLTACIAFYPPTDFQVSRDRKIAPEKHLLAIPPWFSKFFHRCYLVAGADRSDPLVSPFRQETNKFPPNVWIACAAGDSLFRDGEKFIEKLNREGHPNASFHKVSGEGHAFDKLPKRGSEQEKKRDHAYQVALKVIEDSWAAQRTK